MDFHYTRISTTKLIYPFDLERDTNVLHIRYKDFIANSTPNINKPDSTTILINQEPYLGSAKKMQ